MTNAKMLAATYAMLETAIRLADPGNEDKDGNLRRYLLTGSAYGDVINALEADIRTDSARKQGRASAAAACKRIVKNATRDTLKGAWIGTDGMQYVCDGYRAVRYHSPLPLPEAAGMDCTQFFAPDGPGEALDLPGTGSIKTMLVEHRAKYADIPAKERPPCLYDFGDGLPAVNAQYLLDVLEALPDATATAHGLLQPIQLRAPDGDAILLPVRAK